MDKVPDISVIVPVYNAEQTLRKCIDSILSQTFRSFELIIINDGSRDNSGQICDEYSQKDSRIIVLHQENAGVSVARNNGLNKAIGKYICFVDSDDWVEEEYLASFFLYDNPDESCFIIQNCILDYGSCSKEVFNCPGNYYTSEELPRAMHAVLVDFLNPFAKLYRNGIIQSHAIRFHPEIYCGEDMVFVLEYFQYTKAVRYISKAYYHYLKTNPHSLSKKITSFESEYLYFSKLDELFTGLMQQNTYEKRDYRTLCGHALHRLLRSLYLKEYRKGFIERLSILKRMYSTENVNSLLYNHKQAKRWANGISVYLYKYRLFLIYDFYMQIFTFLRY